jgi:hypothetical protein
VLLFGLGEVVPAQPPFPFAGERIPDSWGSMWRFFLKFVDVNAMISGGVEIAMLS